ncbi:organic cation transporter protein-like isoform X2 [Apostichopus japonicus]|uniref:organic cation transporter protein-like isoform X2 n=1 Tax=Stichopus japonicus TaxID=307972 RepID=UPI003AB2C04B
MPMKMDPKTTNPKTFDDILGNIGEMGLYQIIALAMIVYAILPEAMNSMIYVFAGAKQDHWCAVDQWSVPQSECLELRSSDLGGYRDCVFKFKDASIPRIYTDEEPSYSQCSKYDIPYPSEWSDQFYAGDLTNSTVPCDDGWAYDHGQYISTIVSDFDLVCDYKHLAGTTQTIFYAGYLVGSWLSGSISDVIGRYYTFFLSVAIDFVAGMALSFAPSYWFFCLFRFIVGVADISLYLTSFVIVTELVGPSKRIVSGVSVGCAFSAGYMLLALLAYFVRDWRTLQRIASLSLLPIFAFMPFLPESPRWLMDRKKYDKAEEILKTIARVNRTEDKLSALSKDSKQTPDEDAPKPTFIDLFRGPRLRMASLALFCVWFVNSFVYFAISLNTAKLGDDDYFTFFLSGLVEIPAGLICIPLLQSPLGRRYSMLLIMVLLGVSCLAAVVLSKGVLLTVIAMIGKFFVSTSYSMVYLFSAEIFPTIVRSIGVGMCSTMA